MGVQLLSQGSAAVARKFHTLQGLACKAPHALPLRGSIPAPATTFPANAQCPVRSGSHARRGNPSMLRRAIDLFVRVSCPHHAAVGAVRHREKATGFPPVPGACQ